MKPMRSESILKHAKLGLWALQINLKENHNQMYANPIMKDLLGLSQEQDPVSTYEYWWKHIHPSYVSYIEEAIMSLQENEGIEVEYPWYHETLGWRYIRCAGTLIQKNEDLIELEGYHQDVTDLIHENSNLGKDYIILDQYKFRKFSSNYMHAYDGMCEVDPISQKITLIFCQKSFTEAFKKCQDLKEMGSQLVDPQDLSAFQRYFQTWDPSYRQRTLEIRIASKWVRIIGTTVQFNQKESWLLCFLDIDEEVQRRKSEKEKEVLLNILGDAHTQVWDINCATQIIHSMGGKSQNYEDFCQFIASRYAKTEQDELKKFLSLSRLCSIQDNQTIEVQRDDRSCAFGWDRLTLSPSKKEKNHVFLSVRALETGHFIQKMMSRYIENNFEILCYVDLRKDQLIPLRVQNLQLDPQKCQSYQHTVQSYINQYVSAKDQLKAQYDMMSERVLEALKRKKIYYFRLGIHTKNGEKQFLFQYHYFDRSQDLVLMMVSDITEQYRQEESEKKQLEAIRIKANTDHLTGLANRYACENAIRDYLLEDGQEEVSAFLLIDLDDFKEVNDTFGHIQGDQALVDVANGLKHYFRSSDIVSRFGGDEFVVFMKNIKDPSVLPKLMNRLLDQLVFEYSSDQHRLTLRASIGIAIAPRDGMRMETLYDKADQALYDIKNKGKHGYAIYQAEE